MGEKNELELRNPLLSNYERKTKIIDALIPIMHLFTHSNEIVTKDTFSKKTIKTLSEEKNLDKHKTNLLNLLKKVEIVRTGDGALYLDKKYRDEIYELNSLLDDSSITYSVYKKLLTIYLRKYILKNPVIKVLLKTIVSLGGSANMVDLFKALAAQDLSFPFFLLTNGTRPCGRPLYDSGKEPDICKNCSREYSCSSYLSKDGEKKFHDIWKFKSTSSGEGKAVDFMNVLSDGQSEEYLKYESNEELFPLYVKFSIARQLFYGKAFFVEMDLLNGGKDSGDKAKGQYCPWEDIWELTPLTRKKASYKKTK